MVRRVAEEGVMPPPDLGQMRPRQLARADIVRPDGQPDAVVRNRSPAHEFRVHLDQMLKLGAIKLIVAIAQKDDAVRTVAVLIGDVPVVGPLLETDERVITLERAWECGRPKQPR